MKSVACVLALCLPLVFGTTMWPGTTQPMFLTTAPKGCLYNGVHYKPGEQFNPNPCMFCHCDVSGRHMCAIADCAMPPCVDAVNDPKQCCPVCPNGANCRAPDGTMIKEGETYTTSSGAVCKCPLHQGSFWGAQSAICAVQLTPVPAVSKTDTVVSK